MLIRIIIGYILSHLGFLVFSRSTQLCCIQLIGLNESERDSHKLFYLLQVPNS